MQLTDAEEQLLDRLEEAGLNPLALDPWEAWNAFKAYLRIEVDDDLYDAASFQSDGYRAYFVRQFSQWHGQRDAGLVRIVIEFTYYPSGPHLAAAEIWSHDFPTLSEFASVVEGSPQFQTLMSTGPRQTQVYAERI